MAPQEDETQPIPDTKSENTLVHGYVPISKLKKTPRKDKNIQNGPGGPAHQDVEGTQGKTSIKSETANAKSSAAMDKKPDVNNTETVNNTQKGNNARRVNDDEEDDPIFKKPEVSCSDAKMIAEVDERELYVQEVEDELEAAIEREEDLEKLDRLEQLLNQYKRELLIVDAALLKMIDDTCQVKKAHVVAFAKMYDIVRHVRLQDGSHILSDKVLSAAATLQAIEVARSSEDRKAVVWAAAKAHLLTSLRNLGPREIYDRQTEIQDIFAELLKEKLSDAAEN